MELNFTKAGGLYVAEFTVTADFNLHIEKPNGALFIEQSSVEGAEYAPVKDFKLGINNQVIDEGYSALVYPMYIRVKSATMPTKAYVLSQGEVVEGVIVETLNTPV